MIILNVNNQLFTKTLITGHFHNMPLCCIGQCTALCSQYKSCVLPHQVPDYNHLIESCNTKHNDSTAADNDNKQLLLHDQDALTLLYYLGIA